MCNAGSLSRMVRRFGGDRRGNIAVMFGGVATVLAVAVGFGVDTAQLMNAKSMLRAAVDSAVTSTARDLTTGSATEDEAKDLVKAFLSANGPNGVLPSDKIVLDGLAIDRTAKTLEATAHVDVALFFPVFGMEATRRVSNTSAAVYSDKSVEVAMMLDVTGSMAGQKIDDLKTAASNAVDSFLGGQDKSNPRVRIALVPYANSVNAGALAASSVFVEHSAADKKQAGANTDPVFVSAKPRPDTCATERIGAYQYSDVGPDVSMVNRDYLLSAFVTRPNAGWGTAACPDAPVTPLTADADALKTTIGKLAASGGTAGHIGVQWTWYMLSHNWGSVMAASQRPAKPADNVSKYAILMTDGEFNLSYFDVNAVKDVYNGNGKVATRTAATTLCAAMKKQGIEIFTIGFDLTEKNAKSTLESCASADSGSIRHFYQAANGTELDASFQEIARNIQRLALTR